MKIPVITWTVLELGARNPVVRDAATAARRWIGRKIAGRNVTRNDFERVEKSINELREAIIFLSADQKGSQHETPNRLDRDTIRPHSPSDHPGQAGQMETGSSERATPPLQTKIQSDRTG